MPKPKKNRIDSRLSIISSISKTREPKGLSELSEQISNLRKDGTRLDIDETEYLMDLYADAGAGLSASLVRLGTVLGRPEPSPIVPPIVKLKDVHDMFERICAQIC